ncbi:hypothetical protein [Streptomyces nigra]|uniref:hypothetical protein n=1 Tax=Streptomyces nigra TaxID=1827580 RepID=UPI003F4E007E
MIRLAGRPLSGSEGDSGNLFLYALGRFQRDADGELRYSAVEDDLRRLLAEYGPPNRTTPAYPFHHLVSDGVWEVRTDRGPGSPGSGVRKLREIGASGRLTPELRAALRRELSLLGRMARVLLDLNFPPSLQGDLCEAVGLELEPAESEQFSAVRGRRDPRMREQVLTAYEYQCVGHSPAAREHVIALAGRTLIGPRPGASPVAAVHRSWHTGQVFHGRPRPAPAA